MACKHMHKGMELICTDPSPIRPVRAAVGLLHKQIITKPNLWPQKGPQTAMWKMTEYWSSLYQPCINKNHFGYILFTMDLFSSRKAYLSGI